MRPTRDNTLLDIAELWARRSTCNRLHVGAVIARDSRPLTSGYNGPASGMMHCAHPENEYLDTTTQPCIAAVHAEVNTIAFAARHGVATDGADMYLTHSPCYNCAKLIINAGIVCVTYRVEFRDLSGVKLLSAAGIKVNHVW